MKQEDLFKLDMEAEKSSLNSRISVLEMKDNLSESKFDAIQFSKIEMAKMSGLDIFEKNIETVSPIMGSITPVTYDSKPILQTETSQRDLLSQSSSQEKIYKQLNTMSMAMHDLYGQIQRKQDLLSDDKSVTESRITVQQRNLMFSDRLVRTSVRPSWA